MSAIYVGPEEKGMEYVRRFTAHNPLGQSVSILQWNRPIKDNRFGVDAMAYMKGGNYSILGANLYKFDATTFIGLFDKFDSFYTKNSTLSASILILERFPNTITKRVPDEATAYSYHDALGYMKDARSLLIIIHRADFISFVLPDAASAAVAEQFGQATRDELVATGGNNGSLEVYVNYAHGDEGQVAWYSKRKLPRLRALKSRWDPKELFS